MSGNDSAEAAGGVGSDKEEGDKEEGDADPLLSKEEGCCDNTKQEIDPLTRPYPKMSLKIKV